MEINVIDTPGHADFGGEVERVLNMADGALLIVDAYEGPKPQTRFVLSHALERGLRIVVVVNKIDRPNADPEGAVDKVFDLMVELGASDEQLDFPVVYASAVNGYARREPDDGNMDMVPLLDTILDEIPAPDVDIDGPASPNAKSLPEWAPVELKDLDEQLPQQLDWAGYDEFGGADGSFTRNGHTISAEKARLYLFADLGVSQRWTNKFSEVGIETVGDLVGKSEEDLLRIDGIGAKAIEELRDGLEAHDLLYILENNDDVADEEDLSQLLQMVFSPDGPDDILLGTSAAPTHHADADEELLGAPIDDKKAPANGAINEDMASLDELLNQLVDTDDAEEAKDNDEE